VKGVPERRWGSMWCLERCSWGNNRKKKSDNSINCDVSEGKNKNARSTKTRTGAHKPRWNDEYQKTRIARNSDGGAALKMQRSRTGEEGSSPSMIQNYEDDTANKREQKKKSLQKGEIGDSPVGCQGRKKEKPHLSRPRRTSRDGSTR